MFVNLYPRYQPIGQPVTSSEARDLMDQSLTSSEARGLRYPYQPIRSSEAKVLRNLCLNNTCTKNSTLNDSFYIIFSKIV